MRRRRLATSIIVSETSGSCSQSREAPVAGRQDAQGLLDAPAERDRVEARALPRARGDGEGRAVPGGVAGDVLAGAAAVADQPPQPPAGGVGAREQRIGAVLVVE